MFIIMSMNAYVNGAVILGMTLGQLFFEYYSRMNNQNKSAKD